MLHLPAFTVILGQALGLAAMSIDIWGTTLKNDRKLVLSVACSSLLFAIHFLLLSAPAGAFNEMVTTVRSATAAYYRRTALGVGFLCVYALLSYKTVHSWIDLAPCIACLAGTVAMFWCSGVRLRVLFAIGQAGWLLYSIHAASIGGTCLYGILVLGTIRTGLQLKGRPAGTANPEGA
jgi:hypothetical protein